MRIVVLGATGNVGTAVLHRLVLDHLDGAEGLSNAGHRSHSPTE